MIRRFIILLVTIAVAITFFGFIKKIPESAPFFKGLNFFTSKAGEFAGQLPSFLWLKTPDSVNNIYTEKKKSAEIIKFYENKLLSDHWTFVKRAKNKIVYKKDGRTLILTIILENKGATKYQIAIDNP